MFYNSPKIFALDLSSFVTNFLKSMSNMFINNEKLLSIDLSSFDISSVTDMSYMIYNCQNLIYLNLKSFTENKGNVNIDNINVIKIL